MSSNARAAVSLVLTFAVGAYDAAHALGLDGSVGTGMPDGAGSLALVTLGFFVALSAFVLAESVRSTAELLADRRRA